MAVCQDPSAKTAVEANPNASWIAVARRSRDTALARAKASRQSAHHRPPPKSAFPPCQWCPPQSTRGRAHSKTQ